MRGRFAAAVSGRCVIGGSAAKASAGHAIAAPPKKRQEFSPLYEIHSAVLDEASINEIPGGICVRSLTWPSRQSPPHITETSPADFSPLPDSLPVETDSITSATGLVGVAENCRVRVNALA